MDESKTVKNPHEGHRKRMRERFLTEGLKGFQPHEALELLLYYAIPYRDTNELAHRLMEQFGSLSRVLEATPEQLMQVPGISQNAAVLLGIEIPLWRAYQRDAQRQKPVLDTFSAASAYLLGQYRGQNRESFMLLCLDPRGRLSEARTLSTGTSTWTQVPPRLVVEEALRFSAVQVIFAHNHPEGSARPSPEDIVFTGRMYSILSQLEVRLNDHIIVGAEEGDVVSMHRLNLMGEAFRPAAFARQSLNDYDPEG